MSEKEINELIQTGEFAKIDPSAELVNEAVKEPEAPEELLEAAEAHADKQLEDLKDEKNKRKKMLIKFGVMGMLAAIIMVFASIAWFTQNREVSSGSMAVKTSPSPFELEVRGTYIENDNDFSKADSNYTYGEDQQTLNAYQTSGQSDRIIWRKTSNTADDGHYTKGLEPNSHGKLTFWVVPNESGTLDINFEFGIRGFIGSFTEPEDEDEEPELTFLVEINDDLTIANSGGLISTAAQLADKKAALEFIQGHILFFSDFDGTYYSGFLGTGRSIRFGNCINPASETTPKSKYNADDAVSVTKGDKYQITIYWKWANTFEQMVFDETSPKKDNPLFVSTNTTDRTAIYTYLNANNSSTMTNKVFKELTVSAITTDLGYVQNNTSGLVDAATKALTDAYNNADSFIGNNIDYIMIEMKANSNSN